MSLLVRLRSDPRIARLESVLASRPCVEVDDPLGRRAAVAILIRLGGNAEPEILFIQRALYEGDPWSGQIAFPGGREERGDTDLAATAIREACEELGYDLGRDATLIGTLDDLSPRIMRLPRVVVRPFVFLMADPPAPRHSREVADSFWVPLSVLLDRSVWRETDVMEGLSGFALHHEGHVIWGMTERILSGLLAMFE